MSFLATTGGISDDNMRDLKRAAVKNRFGLVNRCRSPLNDSQTMGAATSLARPTGLPARSGRSRGRHRSNARRAMALPKPSFAPASATMFASTPTQMQGLS